MPTAQASTLVANQYSDKSNTIPDSFAFYHFQVAFPRYASSRPEHLKEVFQNFNILGLIRNLFTPYKRMTLSGKVSLSEKLSYNLISMLVGAMARVGLMIVGLLMLVFFAIFDFLSIGFYLIFPVFSYLEYEKLKNEHLTTLDLQNNTNLAVKIIKSKLFANVEAFFDENFKNLFNKLPEPATLGVQVGEHTYLALVDLPDKWPDLKNYLSQNSIKPEDYKLLVSYLHDLLTSRKHVKLQPIGQNLIYGYTNTLERFGTELTTQSHPPFYGKKDILEKIEKVLSRSQNNNAVLVGEAGVGKHTVLEALAQAITRGTLSSIADKRLILLDTVALVGTAKNLPEAQSNFENLLTEAKRAGNIILAFDQVDRITSSQDGRTDMSQVINTKLTDNKLPLIGLSSIDDYNQYVRTNGNINALFERVDIEEPNREELITILIAKAEELYQKEHFYTTFTSILEIVDQSSRLMADKKQPEKAIIIFQDSVAEVKRKNIKALDVETVDEVISAKSKTPIGKISSTEASKLSDLESILHQRIVGQTEAIAQISKAMRRARAQIEKTKRPMGSFLFLGPTGVGKTETSKALAQAYFGAEDKMVRFDMTEFQGTDALSRLIGNPGTKAPGQLATQVRENPYGILLVDEFEKANKDVQNLFLQILDEGNLTDAFGKKVSFTNVIVIATSNAAAEFIREEVEKSQLSTDIEQLTKKLIDHVLSQGLFSPELINRFDATVVFKPLNQQEVVQVAYLMLQQLAKNIKESKNITLEVSPELAQVIAKEGFVQAFGARPIRRLIQDKIEDEVAKQIISGKVKNGDTIHSAETLRFLS